MADNQTAISVYREGRENVPPVFIVPGGGGQPQGVAEIANGLDPSIGVCSLSALGADGGADVATTVEEMADFFLKEIRAYQPHGPYRLIGYSAGGMISIEMGRRLHEMGESFEPLIFLDCLTAHASKYDVSFLQKLWLARKWPPSFALNWLSRYLSSRRSRRMGEEALQKISDGDEIDAQMAAQRMVLVTNSAVEQYVSPLVDFDIVLFRASLASLMFLAAGPKLGWDTVTHGTIKVINKKCDHLTMLEDPIATQIGQEISEIYAVRA